MNKYAIHLYIGPQGTQEHLHQHLELKRSDYGLNENSQEVLLRVRAEYKRQECGSIILFQYNERKRAMQWYEHTRQLLVQHGFSYVQLIDLAPPDDHPPGPKGQPVSHSFTVTWSKVVENGPGMEKIGTLAPEGFLRTDLETAQKAFERVCPGSTRLLDLNEALPPDSVRDPNACILIVRDAARKFFGMRAAQLREELVHLGGHWDCQKFMRGTVKQSIARRNLCISTYAQAPDIARGKGTVVPWSDVPGLHHVQQGLSSYLGPKAVDLHAEGNFYHHPKAGIGFHGDAERKIVIAMRFGEPLRLHYQAYHRFEPVGERLSVDDLREGDLYIMASKATGHDWRSSSILTWRHAAERFHGQKPVYCRSLEEIRKKKRKQ